MAKRLMMIMISVLMVFSLLVPTVSAEDSSGTLGEEGTINEVIDEELPSAEVTDEGDETEVEIIEDDEVSTSDEENETVEEVIEEEKDPATATEAQDETTIVEEGTSDDALQVQSNDQDAVATEEQKDALQAYLSNEGETSNEYHLDANYHFNLNEDGYLEVKGTKTLVTTVFDLTAEGNFTDGATAFIVIRPGATLNLLADRDLDRGVISLDASGISYTILNFGTLNVNGSIIENTSKNGVVIHNGEIEETKLNGIDIGADGQSNSVSLVIDCIELLGSKGIELAEGVLGNCVTVKPTYGPGLARYYAFSSEETAREYFPNGELHFKLTYLEGEPIYICGDYHDYFLRRIGDAGNAEGYELTITYSPSNYSNWEFYISDMWQGLKIVNELDSPVTIGDQYGFVLDVIESGGSAIFEPKFDHIIYNLNNVNWTNDHENYEGIYVGSETEKETIEYKLGESHPFHGSNCKAMINFNVSIDEGIDKGQSASMSVNFSDIDNDTVSSIDIIVSRREDNMIEFSMPQITDEKLVFWELTI